MFLIVINESVGNFAYFINLLRWDLDINQIKMELKSKQKTYFKIPFKDWKIPFYSSIYDS